jgi:hypothetical protein
VDVFGELLEDTPSRQGGQSHFAPKAPQNRDSPRRRDIKLLPAPWKTRRNKTTEAIYTFADLLLNIGFGDGNALLAHLAAWRSLFELVRPDVLVCDHSPTALLAAKTCPLTPTLSPEEREQVGESLRDSLAGFGETGLRGRRRPFAIATVGTGFFTPPDEAPLRLLRPVPEDQLPAVRARETSLLEIMNSILPQCSHHAPHDETSDATPITTAGAHATAPNDFITRRVMTTLDRVTQLYHDGRTKNFLLTFPELDHFTGRIGGDYRGALPYGLSGQPFVRPIPSRRISPSPLAGEGRGEGKESARCIFAYLKPTAALEDLLLGLSRANYNTMACIDGWPLARAKTFASERLSIAEGPIDIRQAAGGTDAAGILSALEQVLSDPRYTAAARAFAQRHKDDNLADIPRQIVDDLEQRAAENASR